MNTPIQTLAPAPKNARIRILRRATLYRGHCPRCGARLIDDYGPYCLLCGDIGVFNVLKTPGNESVTQNSLNQLIQRDVTLQYKGVNDGKKG